MKRYIVKAHFVTIQIKHVVVDILFYDNVYVIDVIINLKDMEDLLSQEVL